MWRCGGTRYRFIRAREEESALSAFSARRVSAQTAADQVAAHERVDLALNLLIVVLCMQICSCASVDATTGVIQSGAHTWVD